MLLPVASQVLSKYAELNGMFTSALCISAVMGINFPPIQMCVYVCLCVCNVPYKATLSCEQSFMPFPL